MMSKVLIVLTLQAKKNHQAKPSGSIFKRRLQQLWNSVLVLLVLPLHLLILAQGVKAHNSGNNKVRLDKVKPTEKWRGGQYLGSEARPLSACPDGAPI